MPEAKFDRERTLKLRPGFAAGVCRSFLETLRDHLFHGPVNREFGCQRGPESLRSLLPYSRFSKNARVEATSFAGDLAMRESAAHARDSTPLQYVLRKASSGENSRRGRRENVTYHGEN